MERKAIRYSYPLAYAVQIELATLVQINAGKPGDIFETFVTVRYDLKK